MSISITINQTPAPDAPGAGPATAPGSVEHPEQPVDAGGPPAWVLNAVAEAGGLAGAPDPATPPAETGTHDGGAAPL